MVKAAGETSNAVRFCSYIWLLGVYLSGSQLSGATREAALSILFTIGVLASIWWHGLREKWEGDDTASAYSVFNENGKNIAGTFTSRQFDNSLRTTYAGKEDKQGELIYSNRGKSDAPPSSSSVTPAQRRANAVRAAEKRLQSSTSTSTSTADN